ncbi:MAG: hypothetical protein AAFX53_13890, partial [Bacteroidota bacterium]
MVKSEREFIDLCKRRIEEKFSFGNGRGYTQRDLQVLSAHIEEKTGVSISLSTLKRLWKNKYKQSPQLATLNALAQVLDYKGWQSFKQANLKEVDSRNPSFKWVLTVFVVVIISVVIFVFSPKPREATKKKEDNLLRITGPVHFEASKTITKGVPNSVVFSYDVTNVIADSFYIQQSWDPNNKVAIEPEGRVHTSIYYESGYHRARLMADDSIIAQSPIHILSNGWEPHLYYEDADLPINLKEESFLGNGRLHLDETLLEKHSIDYSKGFYTRISNTRVFDLHSDSFSLFTRLKVDGVLNT